MVLRNYLASGVLLITALGACKGNEPKVTETPVNAEEGKAISEAEDALLSKRDALFNMRRDITAKRVALAEKRSKVQAKGGDVSEIEAQDKALMTEESDLAFKERALSEDFLEVSNRRLQLAAGSNLAGRESALANRERAVARRENTIAEREAALASREEGLASKWKDSCVVGSTQTIVRTVDVKGSSYSQKDVEPLLTKARRAMSKKGLLASDLPEQARGLEREANKAMKDGDYGRARLAASQLFETVRATKIDKSFIGAKIQRLNQRMQGKKLSGTNRNRAEKLFREATSSYGDGKFKPANGKLNKIYGVIR